MRIFIEHPASAESAAVITPRDESASVWAARVPGNPLDDGWSLDSVDEERLICWSGSLADELFESNPLTWLAPGHDALRTFCDDIAPRLCAQSRRLCFQPHARHVLSDPPSVFTFLRQRHGEPFEALLSPAEMLEPSMLETIDDHLVRMFEMLGGMASGLVLHDVAVDASGECCSAAPLGEGLLPRSLVRRLISDCCPPDLPVIISGQAAQQQLAWLRPGGG